MRVGRYGVVRPYEAWMRNRMSEFIESIGYEPAPGSVLQQGASDAEAASWVDTVPIQLLLLPYNKHRSAEGTFVDGVGVALLLSEAFACRPVPILMPITEFSLNASFGRRFTDLEKKRPEVASRVIVISETERDWKKVGTRVREIAAG